MNVVHNYFASHQENLASQHRRLTFRIELTHWNICLDIFWIDYNHAYYVCRNYNWISPLCDTGDTFCCQYWSEVHLYYLARDKVFIYALKIDFIDEIGINTWFLSICIWVYASFSFTALHLLLGLIGKISTDLEKHFHSAAWLTVQWLGHTT